MVIVDFEKLETIKKLIEERRPQDFICKEVKISAARLKDTARAHGFDLSYSFKVKNQISERPKTGKPVNDRVARGEYPKDRNCIRLECKRVFRSHGRGNQHCPQCIRYINSSAYS